MLNSYDYLDQQVLDRRTQFLKEAEQEALAKFATKANSTSGRQYRRGARLSLRHWLGVLLMNLSH